MKAKDYLRGLIGNYPRNPQQDLAVVLMAIVNETVELTLDQQDFVGNSLGLVIGNLDAADSVTYLKTRTSAALSIATFINTCHR